jgi:hypothetical protein
MKRNLRLGTAVILLVAFGVVEGLWTDRWALSGAVEQATDRLGAVPAGVGDWESKDEELDARQIERSGMSGYLMRQYTHRRTGETIQVLLVCGKPGPTCVHTPDVCYRGAGYVQQGPAKRRDLGGPAPLGPAQFWTADFVKQDAVVPERLRIYWGWGTSAGWQAPDNPRVSFVGQGALYKLYVIRHVLKTDDMPTADPASAFVRVLLPQLNQALFAAP